MEDPFVTDVCYRGPAINNGSVPVTPFSLDLESSEGDMLQGRTAWEQSLHNLRYGLRTQKKPEDVMSYQGPAQHKTEMDPVMTFRYQSYQQERRRAEYLQQKFGEKQAELEELRQQAEQDE